MEAQYFKIKIATAIDLCRLVEPFLKEIGYHCGLTGGCLYNGGSNKDVDILIYPHDPTKLVPDGAIQETLALAGFALRYETDTNYVNRQVWLCGYNGIRVDFFLR